jgi:hypothetical protein
MMEAHTMLLNENDQPRQERTSFENPTRAVRLNLTKKQIELMVEYALRNGYKRKSDTVKMDLTEQNVIARYGIMLRLGFSQKE